MRLYFAAPLFNSAERNWNVAIAGGLRAAGHEVFLPQEKEPGLDGPTIFARDVSAVDWAEAVVAIMDGSEPDSGTAWEMGYAFGKRPVVLVRTDIRAMSGDTVGYNVMVGHAASVRLDLPAATTEAVIDALLEALDRIQAS